MRTWIFVALLAGAGAGCGGGPRPAARPVDADRPPPAATRPPFTALADARTWHLALAERGAPRCLAWEVGEVGEEALELVARHAGVTQTLLIEADGSKRLKLVERTRETAESTASQPCELSLAAREQGDVLYVGRARWFRDRAACEHALRTDEPVLTDLASCPLP